MNGFAELGSLYLLNNARTRSISAENPTGAKGMGGMAIPRLNDPSVPHAAAAINLGQGWKVRPFLRPRAGETVTLMDVAGPGIIQHVWMVTETDLRGNGRACVVRMYWDGEETPSVEAPMSDFFAVGHEIVASVNSLPVIVNPTSALTCFWPMPFRKHARITFSNESEKDLSLLAYQITYAETEVPEDAGAFHAQYRQATLLADHPEHTIVDGIRGHGRYVGTFLAWTQLSDGWFGEGEVKFFLDGDAEFPTIAGTGTEDYFLGSYGFPHTYTGPYAGCAYKGRNDDGPTKWSLYRWHIMDPICFDQDLRVTIQALGWGPDGRYRPLRDEAASVAYWYQAEPHEAFPVLPAWPQRWPR